MNADASMINAVVDLLRTRGGFRPVPKPLHIADVEFDFEFDAVLAGPGAENTLVFVADIRATPIVAVERRMRAVSLVLGRVQFSCPITLVLITGVADDVDVSRLEQLCRVLTVREEDRPQMILMPLLPLELPERQPNSITATKALEEQLGSLAMNALAKSLIRAARDGSSEVERAIVAAVDAACVLQDDATEDA